MIRLGVDFGGTKIEIAALDDSGACVARRREPNPGSYRGALDVVRDLVAWAEGETGTQGLPVGVGIPGSISPATGLVRNANSTWLNGQAFDIDLAQALQRPVRLANDANCFTLSEATDGAARGCRTVFGVILGTGCGGGVTVNGALIDGANRIAGEWGHTPLPWAGPADRPARTCWCGRPDCVETWVSGTGFGEDYRYATGMSLTGDEIMQRARAGDSAANDSFARYADRLGRALAVVCDILDPDIIVCGGGMSNTGEIYTAVPPILARWAFSDRIVTPIVPAVHGDSSGVRGAAWLWPAS